jgi:hypothetical protein
MADRIRQHRVTAFCDWLDTIPASPPIYTRPEFRFYRDLTADEFDAAADEMRRRGEAALAEARELQAFKANRRG